MGEKVENLTECVGEENIPKGDMARQFGFLQDSLISLERIIEDMEDKLSPVLSEVAVGRDSIGGIEYGEPLCPASARIAECNIAINELSRRLMRVLGRLEV